MRIGSVYSGVLGLDVGVEHASGGKVVWTCESEAYPRAVIFKHRSALPCYTSDEAIPEDAESVDCLIGGVPCQPSSIAGKRKGTNDDRWRWPHFMALARRFGPRFIFVENPPGLLSLDDGRAFGWILSQLDAMGFDARWLSLRASDVGAPHRRERIFLLAWRRVADADSERPEPATTDARGPTECDGGMAHTYSDGFQRVGGIEPVASASECSGSSSSMADPDGSGCAEQRQCGLSQDSHTQPGDDALRCDGTQSLDNSDSTRLQGTAPLVGPSERCEQACEGKAESSVGRVLDGTSSGLDADRNSGSVSHRLESHTWPAPPGAQFDWEAPRVTQEVTNRRARLKALGNAVVPQQAAEAWRRLWLYVPESAKLGLSMSEQ